MSKFSIVSKMNASLVCLWSSSPQIFWYDDEGYAENIFEGDANTGTKEIADNLEADLIDAAEGCPTEAIKVQDSPFN